MPPKRRDKDVETTKSPRSDHIQADHELFLQAFEKPTQIYRFLRTRSLISPIFVNRTLTYMRSRMSRNHKGRPHFVVNSMLKQREAQNEIGPKPGYMTLSFLGVYGLQHEGNFQMAEVETILLKVSHKKRKDSVAPTIHASFGKTEVFVNPSTHSSSRLPSVTIPSESFNLSNGTMPKSYLLMLKVQCSSSAVINEIDDEPSFKKRKPDSSDSEENDDTKRYFIELTVYDRHNRCVLTDGDYEIVLQELRADIRSPSKKHSSWENAIELANVDNVFDQSLKGPILKFKLDWYHEQKKLLVGRLTFCSIMYRDNKENVPKVKTEANEDRMQIIYQFLYNNNSRQQTEACESFHCPWCSINCGGLYSLLKHLKLCHPRFTFAYVPIAQGARIDISINELYDGSYTGSPHDLISQPSGCAFSRNGPVRRATVSHLLIFRPKRPKPSLSEFLELDDAEFDGQRPYITGHNRLYHHTTTCLPIYPKEMDVDSEGENDPKWLQTKTMMMIDEFTDVNEGEKELMKLWNLHVMKYGYVGDCQIPLACQMFQETKGEELLMKNLYRNFVVHLCSLFDFGLISPVILYNTVKKLQGQVGKSTAASKVLCDSREAQMDNWKKGETGQSASSDCPKPRKTSASSTSQHLRRKGSAASTSELPTRRTSIGEPTKKRLSLK